MSPRRPTVSVTGRKAPWAEGWGRLSSAQRGSGAGCGHRGRYADCETAGALRPRVESLAVGADAEVEQRYVVKLWALASGHEWGGGLDHDHLGEELDCRAEEVAGVAGC